MITLLRLVAIIHYLCIVQEYNMGVLYRTGRGVDANMEEALRWYRLSAAQGYDQAIDFLNQYEKKSVIGRHTNGLNEGL